MCPILVCNIRPSGASNIVTTLFDITCCSFPSAFICCIPWPLVNHIQTTSSALKIKHCQSSYANSTTWDDMSWWFKDVYRPKFYSAAHRRQLPFRIKEAKHTFSRTAQLTPVHINLSGNTIWKNTTRYSPVLVVNCIKILDHSNIIILHRSRH